MENEEKELLERLKSGDTAALEQLIAIYTPYVSTVIRNQLGACRAADVEELAATVFFTLWEKRRSIRTNLRPWLAKVAKNCARTFQRRQKKQQKIISLEDVILVEKDKALLLTEARERTRILKLALDELGPTDSEIFTRYYYHEQTTAEIGTALGLHPEAVKSRLRRGREKLKEILQREGYEG